MPWVRNVIVQSIEGNISHYETQIAPMVSKIKLNAQIRQTAETEIEKLHHAHSLLSSASLWWVSTDMVNLALDASQDIPQAFWREIFPGFSGFMGFEGELPPVRIGGERSHLKKIGMPDMGTAKPIALSWNTLPGGGGWEIEIFARSKTLPKELQTPHELSPIARIHTPQSTVFEGQEVDGVTAFIAAAFTLMLEPKVVSKRIMDPKTGGTPKTATLRNVILIDLRPLKTITEATDDKSNREYHHRWAVRGHWRNQAVGEGRSERKLTWVSGYLKGPENAPIIRSEKVNVWRR